MPEEISEALVADVLEEVTANIAAIQAFHQQRLRLTAEGSSADKRVTIVVNADGVIIETRLADDVGELSYAELAKAMTTAAQRAVAEIRRVTGELLAPIRQRQERLPAITELFPGMPELTEALRVPAASTVPPQDRARGEAGAGAEPDRRSRLPEVTDRSW